ncbi:MAG: DUF4038 domain-containing protein [Kiritimatiellae bacterium]|nr:DUF4038 domain-containing protein [Kiritimatiellia bacterium]
MKDRLPLPAAAGRADVPRYDIHEIVLTAAKTYANPFADVAVRTRFVAPSGRELAVPGYHDGGNTWRVRIAPDEEGAWRFRTESVDPGLNGREGAFQCVASGSTGFLRRHPKHPGAFAWDDGTPFFHLGDTCYNLPMLDRDTQRRPYLDTRAGQGFNLVRFTLYRHSQETWPFGGNPNEPDPDRYNPGFFRAVDEILRDLQARNMCAELILEQFYTGVMCRPELWTAGRERAWLDYVVARYAAFTNVAYWTLTNEYEVYPDGQYRFDCPGDVDWARNTARHVRGLDPFGHMIAVHPDRSDPIVGDLFGPGDAFDIIMRQTHGERRDVGGYSDGSGAGMERTVQKDLRWHKPVVVAEFGYEYNGHTKKGVNTSTDLLRRHAWRIVMGGGHLSAGFRGTVFNFTDVMTFDITNNGGAGAEQMSFLKRFMSECAFWRLRPEQDRVSHPHLCLADGGTEYVCFVPEPLPVFVKLQDVPGPFAVEWLNPITGARDRGPDVEGGAPVALESPFCPEAVLRLRRRG